MCSKSKSLSELEIIVTYTSDTSLPQHSMTSIMGPNCVGTNAHLASKWPTTGEGSLKKNCERRRGQTHTRKHCDVIVVEVKTHPTPHRSHSQKIGGFLKIKKRDAKPTRRDLADGLEKRRPQPLRENATATLPWRTSCLGHLAAQSTLRFIHGPGWISPPIALLKSVNPSTLLFIPAQLRDRYTTCWATIDISWTEFCTL